MTNILNVFATEPFHCHAVAYSPYRFDGFRRLAVAASQYFGLIGNGKLYVVDLLSPESSAGGINLLRVFSTRDVLLDCAWSERSETHLLGACSDGFARLWDLSHADSDRPLVSYPVHASSFSSFTSLTSSSLSTSPSSFTSLPADSTMCSVHSVAWNAQDRALFACGGDSGVSIWTAEQATPLWARREHRGVVYQVAWSPHKAGLLCSASADRALKLWDIYAPRAALTVPAHAHHALSCDFAKYSEHLLASSSADRSVRLWDLRSPHAPLLSLGGHALPVRRVRWSPHRPGLLASVSYDRSLRVWDVQSPSREDALTCHVEHHTEFATGLDFSLFSENEVATCGWDSKVVVSSFNHQVID